MTRRAPLMLAVLTAGCFSTWPVGGPWQCGADAGCSDGLTCDDGVCCVPGGSPACPTLPANGLCPSGAVPTRFFPDVDGDGHGALNTPSLFCVRPVRSRWVTTGDDCDDSDPAVSPVATERCNGRDDTCNGVIDEGTTPVRQWYLDEDGDGFGACAGGTACQKSACGQPPGFAARGGDCDPTNAAIHPGAEERCDGIDQNCNGLADDPPFLDVEPTIDGKMLDCSTGRSGVCASGALECRYAADAGRYEKACVARVVPSVERCNGLDDDCNGTVDEAPGCGGPRALLSTPGIRFAALKVIPAGAPDGGSRLPPRCLAREPGGQAMAWLNPTWVGTGSERHIWSAQAESTWDVARPGATLRLALNTTYVGSTNPANGAWADGTLFPNPVVTLCGETDSAYRRWVPSASQALKSTQLGVSVELPLSGTAAGWTVENGPTALDLSKVRRLEVVVAPQQAVTGVFTFTITLSRDAGFGG